jgi:hypothetical protein
VGGLTACTYPVHHYTHMTIPMFLRLPLAVLVLALVVITFVSAYFAIVRWFIAWNILARTFPVTPVTDVHKLGKQYSGQNGYYYRKGNRAYLNYLFRIEVAQEGLLVTGYFARRLPILIPWSDIQNVEDVDVLGVSKAMITVNYENERRIIFNVPKEALTVIQENVPRERLHKTDSLSQLIKNRLNNPRKP